MSADSKRISSLPFSLLMCIIELNRGGDMEDGENIPARKMCISKKERKGFRQNMFQTIVSSATGQGGDQT